MEANISTLIDLSEEELLERLGFEIDRVSPGVKPLTPQEAQMVGKSWLSRQRARIRDAVCSSEQLKSFRLPGKTHNRVVLAAAILDVIAGLSGIVGPATVAVLLAKEGLDTLCGDSDTALNG